MPMQEIMMVEWGVAGLDTVKSNLLDLPNARIEA
jgi:hypothetical protein